MFFTVKQDFIKTEVTDEMMIPHVEYMHKLIDKGVVVVSGPYIDSRRGGMFVLEVDNEEDLKGLVENDPAVMSGILKNEIRPYNLAFVRGM